MRRVTYAGESFITTDDLADALFDFIAALERGGSGESIEIPAIVTGGAVQGVRLLVWPGSELLAVHLAPAEEADESAGGDIAAELRRKSAQLHAVRTSSVGGPSSWSLVDPDEFFRD